MFQFSPVAHLNISTSDILNDEKLLFSFKTIWFLTWPNILIPIIENINIIRNTNEPMLTNDGNITIKLVINILNISDFQNSSRPRKTTNTLKIFETNSKLLLLSNPSINRAVLRHTTMKN
jgi:hypothetical protein